MNKINLIGRRSVLIVAIILSLLFISGLTGCNPPVESPGPNQKSVDFNKIPNINVFEYEDVANLTIYNGACISVTNSGNPADKVDVTFLAEQYTDLTKFQNDVFKYIDYENEENGLLAIEPFKSNKGKFNFYFVNQTNDLDCKLGCFGIDRLICCNDQKVKRVATQCPSDKIFVLVDTTTFCGASKDYSTVCAITDARAGLVLTHEFGHIFGGFGDEYTYGKDGDYDKSVPNCDASPSCDKWSGTPGTGCFKTCGYTNLYRSIEENSLMNIYVPTFGPLNEPLLAEALSSYTNESSSKELLAAVPIDSSYIANIDSNDGSIDLDGIYVTNSTSEDLRSEANYLGRILSFDGRVLTTFKIFIATQHIYDKGLDDKESITSNEAGSLEIKRQNYTFNIPYFSNGRTLELYTLAGEKVDSISLAPLAQMCGDGVCQSQENYLECISDCPLNKKDNLCLPYSDNICDADCPSFGRISDVDCRSEVFVKLSVVVALTIAIVITSTLLRGRKMK